MKRFLFFALPVILFTACLKDRTIPAPAVVVTTSNDTLMYYWTFNNQDSSNHAPDFGVTAGATFQYYASYVDFANGSSVNLIGPISDTGNCLRVRNPSDSLIFFMPTTGYRNVVLQYAEEASSTTSGSTINDLYYTTDGKNYTYKGGYNVTTAFTLNAFDFSSDASTNDNPKFAVKIVFANNNTGTSGNDRFDNVTLVGVRN